MTMLLYSTCFAATLPLVNSVLSANLNDPATESGGIFIWGPIAWALVDYSSPAGDRSSRPKAKGATASTWLPPSRC